jgi:prolyl 4-hydroxylase
MNMLAKANRLARSGRQQDAILLVRQAAATGDPDALFMVANWCLLGLYGARSLAQAHDLLGRAAQGGHAEACRLRAFLIGNGTGCASDPERARQMLQPLVGRDGYAALQLAFLPKMSAPTQVAQLKAEVIREQPIVRRVPGLLLAEECAYLRTLAEPSLQPSFVIDPQTRARVPNPVRTSAGMSFGPIEEDLVIHSLNRRFAMITGTDVSWGEPLHILRYLPGQEYRPHIDALPGVQNQRHWTVLVYLNAEYEGGETHFPELEVTIRGKIGDGLIFANVDADGRPDLRTRHAGCPVRSGSKWLATRWIRAEPYHPWDDA